MQGRCTSTNKDKQNSRAQINWRTNVISVDCIKVKMFNCVLLFGAKSWKVDQETTQTFINKSLRKIQTKQDQWKHQ
jgi:hypothetical protein